MDRILIDKALYLGARIHASVSGGKDGQAMVKTLVDTGYPIDAMIHCDLGRVEWPQSISMCEKQSLEFNLPLHILQRSDNLDLLAYWQRRMKMLEGTGKPFWSSATERYCTSDLKRGPSDRYFTRQGNFNISAEGIRALESKARAKKQTLSIRKSKTSTYYNNMSVVEAIKNYHPEKRLTLNWYPVFDFTIGQVWATYGMSESDLIFARGYYLKHSSVPDWWPFHPAYAFGNERVSCMFCVLACLSDLQCGAKHNPQLLNELVRMEKEGNATFKNGWSLKSLIGQK